MAEEKERKFSQEQYDLLIKSSKEGDNCKLWNDWRKNNPDTKIKLEKANLVGSNLFESNLSNACLKGAYLLGAILINADLKGTNLVGSNLVGSNLFESNLSNANLKNADLKGAVLSGANLSNANLNSADLFNANLSNANLNNADLKGADLFAVNLLLANLIETNLSNTNLVGANLSNAELRDVNLENATLGNTTFGNVDFNVFKIPNTLRHTGPSTIGIDTLYQSKGKIPKDFLRKVGISEKFITYIHSFVKGDIEYPSCFISHSSKDQEFTEKLYADLQNKGVRCWYAPEDLKIGDKFRQSINQAIRIHDKLLLVLSENSINSKWVENEVETAFEKEGKRKETVLFPIMLDSSVMETDKAWATDIRRTRHIGDFSEWKEHDKYQTSLDRLLRDLKERELKD